jgi:D-serine dehydratase
MDKKEFLVLSANDPMIQEMSKQHEVVWINDRWEPFHKAAHQQDMTIADIEDAAKRLERFAPYIQHCFPETRDRKGIIESDLVEIPHMQALINQKYASNLCGKLLLKKDSHLAIAGSVKARGGIYEVLKHTEELAIEHGILMPHDIMNNSGTNAAYLKLAEPCARQLFGQYTIQVSSTGNLGISIGMISAKIGYHTVVHMSADAKQWKKDLLRNHGVKVVEYESDYGEAVKNGRLKSAEDPRSYFVDDEMSKSLFLGYAVAAIRLENQLKQMNIRIDHEHPLFVYIPCGVGGAPGGISFGLKQVYGDAVHCFFAEPVQAPCMLLGLASGMNSGISVQDIGLSGQTHADGLAVSRPSGFVGDIIRPHLSGAFTVKDTRLYDYLRDVLYSEDLFLEPSACAALHGPVCLNKEENFVRYLQDSGTRPHMKNAFHIVWATGGSLVPEAMRKIYEESSCMNQDVG